MRFGISADFRNPPNWIRSSTELYSALLKQIQWAEELGYHNVSLTEHHFTEDGCSPSLLAAAAAIAAQTDKIRIGTFILWMKKLSSTSSKFYRTQKCLPWGPRINFPGSAPVTVPSK